MAYKRVNNVGGTIDWERFVSVANPFNPVAKWLNAIMQLDIMDSSTVSNIYLIYLLGHFISK